MSAQRRAATKQRRSATAAAQGSAPVRPARAPEQKPAAKPQQVQQKVVTAARQSIFRRRYDSLRTIAQNTSSEIRKVTWPDSETTRNLTALVIAMSTILGLLLGGIDFLLLKLFETI